MVKFSPDQDIPDLSGKVIIVTGGNIGLGRESVNQIVKHNPAKVYLAARTKAKADATIAEINQTLPEASRSLIEFLELDLTSFDSIKESARTFTKNNDRLDILINNAGIMAVPAGLTKEGYEIQFGTNHVGHALFTKLLLPTMEKTAAGGRDVRIVNLSSRAEEMAPREGLKLASVKTADAGGMNTWTRYGQSKLANVLYSRALAAKYPTITTTSVHPGVVNTNLTSGPVATYGSLLSYPIKLFGSLFLTPVSKGALNQTWAAVGPLSKTKEDEGVESGTFYHPVGVKGKDSNNAKRQDLVDELWNWTEQELKDQEI